MSNRYKRPGAEPAPEGQVYVCACCGKRARTRYGLDEASESTAIDSGWDESCMLHAVLCFEAKGAQGQWIAVPNLDEISVTVSVASGAS